MAAEVYTNPPPLSQGAIILSAEHNERYNAVWAAMNAHRHPANEINPGAFANGDYEFPANLHVGGTLTGSIDVSDLVGVIDLANLPPEVIGGGVDATATTPGIVRLYSNGTAIVYRAAEVDALLGGKANVVHTHVIGDVTGLQAALDSKAAAVHTHALSDVTGLVSALDGKADDAHTHFLSDVSGLTAALDGKSNVGHGHVIADVSGLQAALDSKLSSAHSHVIADVSGLQSALDGKAAATHSHAITDVTGLQTALDGKAASTHSHAISDVTGLQTALDGKSNVGHTHSYAELTGTPPAASLPANAVTTDAAAQQNIAEGLRARRLATKMLDHGVGTTNDPQTDAEVVLGPNSFAMFNTAGEFSNQGWTTWGGGGPYISSSDYNDMGVLLVAGAVAGTYGADSGVASSTANNASTNTRNCFSNNVYTARLEVLQRTGTLTGNGWRYRVEQWVSGTTWQTCFEEDGVTPFVPRTIPSRGLYVARFRPRNSGAANFVRIAIYLAGSTTVSGADAQLRFRADISATNYALQTDWRLALRNLISGGVNFVNPINFLVGLNSSGGINVLNHRVQLGITSFAGTQSLTTDQLRPFVTLNANSGNCAITLPTTSVAGEMVVFVRLDGSGNTCTVSPGGGGRLIGGSTAAQSIPANGSLRLVAQDTGGNWRIW